MDTPKFITIALTIFILERFFMYFIFLPVSLFPIFSILILASSANLSKDFIQTSVAIIFFDIFSGITFGLFTISFFIVSLFIHLSRGFIMVSDKSVIFNLFFTSFLVLIFYSIFLTKISVTVFFHLLPLLFIEFAILFAILQLTKK